MKQYNIHISLKNSKLGKILSFSTAPIVGCGANCRVCMDKCYAVKSYRQYPNVKTAWNDNFDAVKNEKWIEIHRAVTHECMRHTDMPFRWFVSGDIYCMGMLKTMVWCANTCPDTVFYCYTKCYNIVNRWLDFGNILPDNLKIIFSRWDGLEMVNPYGLPESDVILKGSNKTMVNNSFVCPNQKNKKITCDVCPCPCYLMEKGETVYFMEH